MHRSRDRTRSHARPAVSRAAPALLAAIGLLVGCGAPTTTEAVPLVAVSVLPQAWFVERIAGDRVRVAVMIPPGASPAFFEPTLAQVEAIAEAALYVAVGNLPFEAAWLDRLLAERGDLPVVSVSARAERDTDPHLWVSPRYARAMARSIHGALTQRLPQQRNALDANLAGLLAEIDAVDDYCRRRLAPKRGGTFLVFHPAWGHFAEEYGLVQIAIERDGKEPDARALAERIRGARAAGVPVVFAQPHFNPASAEIVAHAIGARVEILDPLAYAWGDNLRHVADALAGAAVVE
ncbi:MAG: zinc ABC transporter substrate-binding protein [Myxococcales bacterium]|nr:zinc ABC transporter substrate-binding protein [Myxococcales bacterium]